MAECGLSNLATCLPQLFLEFVLTLLNSALQPLVDLAKALLTEPVNVMLFYGLWVIIIYLISLFYGLFFLFAGFNFMISGYNSAKREQAKAWLTNVLLMILFVQSSFFLYELTIELGSLLTASIINLIDPTFFLLQADSFLDLGLNLLLTAFYVLVLLVSVILLGVRYLLVSMGVVFVPIGLFLYFIPPLKSYGTMILSVLAVLIFIPFFDALILLGSSLLMNVSLFDHFSMLVTTLSFVMINLFMICVVLFALLKAAFSVIDSDVGRTLRRTL